MTNQDSNPGPAAVQASTETIRLQVRTNTDRCTNGQECSRCILVFKRAWILSMLPWKFARNPSTTRYLQHKHTNKQKWIRPSTRGTVVVHPYYGFSLRRQTAPQQNAQFRTVFLVSFAAFWGRIISAAGVALPWRWCFWFLVIIIIIIIITIICMTNKRLN